MKCPFRRAPVFLKILRTSSSVNYSISITHGCLVDRSGGTIDLGIPFQSLISLQIETFSSDDPIIKKI